MGGNSTGCTADVRALLKRAKKPLSAAEIVAAFSGRYSQDDISSAVGNLARRGYLRSEKRTVYTWAPPKPAEPAAPSKPRSQCALQELWG